MDIAAVSMAYAQFELQQQASVSIAKKSMDVAEAQMQGLIEMLQVAAPDPEAVPPTDLGQLIDVKA